VTVGVGIPDGDLVGLAVGVVTDVARVGDALVEEGGSDVGV
jgi:hypothetical protein